MEGLVPLNRITVVLGSQLEPIQVKRFFLQVREEPMT